MSILPESPWRGAAAFLSQPVSETDVQAAQSLVETIYYYNTRNPVIPPLADIEYRSSDRGVDVLNHVFRWDKAPYDHVFVHGFVARRQEGTRDETYFNLEHYVNNGGRPLDSQRETTHAFVSTTLSSNWYPRVDQGKAERVYRYEIYAPGGIWVAGTLDDRYKYPGQDEVAFPAGIAPQYIRSAQLFELVGDGQYTRRNRVNTILIRNTNFNPQAYPRMELRILRPVRNYKVNNQYMRLDVQEFPDRRQRKLAGVVKDDGIIDYYTEGVTQLDSYFDSAFRSSSNGQAFMFINKEYILMDYGLGSQHDRVIKGPLFICSDYPSLLGTSFAEYGIDASFGFNFSDEAFVFSGKLCARIKKAPGTKDDKIIDGPKTIRKMFPFFKGTDFENGVDAAFESTETNKAYLFKGSQYALIDFYNRSLISIRLIADGINCFRNTVFSSDIGAAFASHKPNEAYLFKDNKYVLLHFTPGSTEDYIIDGPKDIVPNNWPSLKGILPRKNQGLDYYDSAKPDPGRDQDDG